MFKSQEETPSTGKQNQFFYYYQRIGVEPNIKTLVSICFMDHDPSDLMSRPDILDQLLDQARSDAVKYEVVEELKERIKIQLWQRLMSKKKAEVEVAKLNSQRLA